MKQSYSELLRYYGFCSSVSRGKAEGGLRGHAQNGMANTANKVTPVFVAPQPLCRFIWQGEFIWQGDKSNSGS